jgi:hypothetical protein
MELEVLLALIIKKMEERFASLESSTNFTGPRGPKGRDGRDGTDGINGKNGKDGRDGKDFSLEENEEFLKSWIKEASLKFKDLTEEEINSLKGPKGDNGESFVFSKHQETIRSMVVEYLKEISESLKLKFTDLTDEEKLSLVGPKGPRGQRGSQGKGFVFEEHREYFESLRPKFSDFTEEEKTELKLKFSDLTEEDKNSLKIKFSDLTEEERFSLRGSRGQRGKPGRDGAKGDTGPQGLKGDTGPRGLPGSEGVIGRSGKDGVDGKDAPTIVEVRAEKTGRELSFSFEMSDGEILETNKIDLPKQEIISQTIVTKVTTETGGGTTDSAVKLAVSRIASEDILSGDALKADSPTNVSLADASGTFQDSVVLGFAGNDALAGQTVTVILMGVISNAAFSVFSLNSPVFLDTVGGITDTKRTSGFHTVCGTSLGGTEVFVRVSQPVAIGA